jgi:5-methylcytosine-specific restriction endonuclease McrBC regulatory subunit McrC
MEISSFSLIWLSRINQTKEATVVLDTKYKVHEKPSASDVSQVITYALAKNCTEAVLLYPSNQTAPIREKLVTFSFVVRLSI